MGKIEKDGSVTFGVPKGEIKEAYFELILKQLYHLGMQISQPTTSNNNIPIMVNFIISHIPSIERRKEIRKKIKDELQIRLENEGNIEDRTKITIDTYVEFVGVIADYLENFMGIEKENRLGIIGDKK